MNMVCKVCGAELRGNAKFCNKCGVPLSLIDHFGAEVAGSNSEMTVVAGQADDTEVPTVDSPAIRKPVAAQPATATPPIIANPVQTPTPSPKPTPPTAQISVLAQAPSTALKPRTRHILLSKPAATILFVFIFAAIPLFVPSVGSWLSSKDQSYREMLPDPHELVTFKSSGGSSSDTTIPGGGQTTGEETISSTGTD